MCVGRKRRDNQIGGLELLAICLALSTFRTELEGAECIIYSDNTGMTSLRCRPSRVAPLAAGAESAARSGTSRAFDHASLAHCMWKFAYSMRISIFVLRVASALNLSDLPSREDYALLQRIGQFRPPELASIFRRPQSWTALSLRNMFA